MVVWRAGGTVGVATVVRTLRSAPRLPGATMTVAPDGVVAGSVSGGCVEAASQCTFPQLQTVADNLAAHRPTAVATIIAHPDDNRVGARLVIENDTVAGTLGSARTDAAVRDDARGLLTVGRSTVFSYGPEGERQGDGMEIFVASHAPPPRMLIFGAVDFAAALAQQGSLLGYRVTVCDARPVFATPARFPAADEVVVEWPHRYLAAQADDGAIDATKVICVLTHDPRFDVPVLDIALRLRSPIGLDLGARTPEETAVSIVAEVVASRWGGAGRPLAETGVRIHRDVSDAVAITR
ncbi:XdhC family protein [Rhodococcus sp. NPDC059968]|uniref:XdhC family protein n=1 Tax=Rhodococcus sp. NPDC059968 TaxID=3347017 RepID=UPI00366AB3D6